MNAGPPEISIHQEGSTALLRVRQRQMNRGSGFPFRRGGTGDHQGADAAVEVRQENGVAESADGLLKCAEARGRFAQWNQRRLLVSRRKSSSMPLLYDRQSADYLHGQCLRDLFGVANGVIQDVADDGDRYRQQDGEEERQQDIQSKVRKHGLQSGPGHVRNANRAVLEAGVDACLSDFSYQFLIECLVGLGFPLERLVFERAGVQIVELDLGLRDGFPQHGLAVERFAVLHVDPLTDVVLGALQLLLHFSHLQGGLPVFRVAWTEVRFDFRELLLLLVQALRELSQRLALAGDLGGLYGTGGQGTASALLAHPDGLSIREFGVQLQQAGRQNAGLFFWIDDVEFPFKLVERRTGQIGRASCRERV